MRRVRFEIEVDVDPDGRPALLRYRQRRRRVRRSLDDWRDGGRWWRAEAGRDGWLLELEGGLTVEVYAEDAFGARPERWLLTRVAD